MEKNDVKLFKVARSLEGLQTVSSISKILNVSKRTAINYAWKLRRAGYLATNYNRNKIRLYRIDPLKRKKQEYSIYDIINENSKVKISPREDYIIHSDKKPSVEEILVRAIDTKEFRVILASLGLFNKIKSWPRLKFYADKYNAGRKVGALYDASREAMRTRKMDNKTRKSLLESSGDKFIIKNFKSKDLGAIEKRWKTFIPFNKADLTVYKEW